MPRELIQLRIKEISAVDHPANKRKFLVVKRAGARAPSSPAPATPSRGVLTSTLAKLAKVFGWTPEQLRKAEHEAETFDDSLAARRIGHVMDSLYDQFYALLDTLGSISYSDEAGKPALVKTAITDFVASVKDAAGSIVDDAFSKSADAPAPETLAKFDATRQAIARLLTKESSMAFDLAKITDSAQRDAVKAELDRLAGEVEKATKAAAPEPQPEDVLKGASPAVKAAFDALEKRVTKAETGTTDALSMAATERDARTKAEAVAKAAKDFDGLSGEGADKLGDAMHDLAKSDVPEATRDVIAKVLKAAAAQIKESALYTEAGHGAPADPDSAEGHDRQTREEVDGRGPEAHARSGRDAGGRGRPEALRAVARRREGSRVVQGHGSRRRRIARLLLAEERPHGKRSIQRPPGSVGWRQGWRGSVGSGETVHVRQAGLQRRHRGSHGDHGRLCWCPAESACERRGGGSRVERADRAAGRHVTERGRHHRHVNRWAGAGRGRDEYRPTGWR